VSTVAQFAEDSEASEVVGVNTSNVEDIAGAYAHALAFRFAAAVIDDGDCGCSHDGTSGRIGALAT
jgi:hypothetical protein